MHFAHLGPWFECGIELIGPDDAEHALAVVPIPDTGNRLDRTSGRRECAQEPVAIFRLNNRAGYHWHPCSFTLTEGDRVTFI